MSSWFCCWISSSGFSGCRRASSEAIRARRAAVTMAACRENSYFSETTVPRGDDSTEKWSISRRAPVIPSPMPVVEQY